MKVSASIFLLLLTVVLPIAAQNANETANDPLRVEASPSDGFSSTYYLYVPRSIRDGADEKREFTMLVIPNNSGKTSDDPAFEETDVAEKMKQNAHFADRLGVILLEPAFPRPTTEWQIYTHALDRDSMLTDNAKYRRFDLQLISMINDAFEKLRSDGIVAEKRVLMFGFSASAMFVDRFAFLHPERVKAAAIGSPGGWPIAPADTYKGKLLRYPIGTGDLKTVAGARLDLTELRRVPLFLFMGDKDTNDSVVFRDSYDKVDEDLIFELFGKTPLERWEISRSLYEKNKLNAEFRLYPNVAHTINKEALGDIFAFLKKHAL